MSELPEGFVLDKSAAAPVAAPAGLPDGFVLDKPEQTASGGLPYIGSPDFRLSTIAKNIWNMAKSGATLPGDVYQGKVDPVSEEGLKRAADFAGTAALVNTAPSGLIAKTPGASEMFGGALNSPAFERLGLASKPSAGPMADAAATATGREGVLAAAGRLGVDVPRFVASDSRAIQAAGQAGRQLPIGGSIIENAADKFAGNLQGAAQRVSEGLTDATGLDRSALGGKLRTAVEDAAGNIDETRHAAFANMRSLIDTAKPVKEALAPIQDTISEVMARRFDAGEQGIGQLKPVANLLQRPDGITFDGLQRARSQLSKAINFDARNGGFEQADLKQVREALTNAMEITAGKAAKGDPEAAIAAWKGADQTFSGTADTMKALGQALRSPTDERLAAQVIGMASEKTGNAAGLIDLQRQIGIENMRMLGSHVVDSAGLNAKGEWSAAIFANNIEKMSPTGRRILFGESKGAVDDLTALAKRWAEVEGKFANKSGTGRAALMGASIGVAAADPITAIGKAAVGAAAGVTIGKLLANPVTARSAIRMGNAYVRAAEEGTPAATNAFYALQRQLAASVAREFSNDNQAPAVASGQ